MHFLVVNYHYISERENEYPSGGIYPVSVSRFKEQINKISELFEFVGQDDVLAALDNKKSLSEYSCLITFDDGLKCQYQKALPILDHLKIPALFFINGIIYQKKGKVLLANKVHWCQAQLGPKKFLERIGFYYKKVFKKPFDLRRFDISPESIRKQYKYSDLETAKLKIILNHFLGGKMGKRIVDPIFKELVKNEKEFSQSLYLSQQEIKELYRRSYLGTHGYSHKSFARMKKSEVIKDITDSFKIMSRITGEKKPKIFSISYPRAGKPKIPPKEFIRLLGLNSLKLGFTGDRAFNKNLDSPFFLARFDANDVPGGKKPLFTIKNKKIKFRE